MGTLPTEDSEDGPIAKSPRMEQPPECEVPHFPMPGDLARVPQNIDKVTKE